MALRLYNTLTRRKEEFKPLNPELVTMYSCGPTVYAPPHIGNLRSFIVSDLIARVLRFKGYRLKNIMNLTDVDDKTIAGSIREGLSLKEFTDRHIREFFSDIKTLNIVPASFYPRATEHIPDIVALIKRLKPHTYVLDGSTYFRISSFKGYGRLARLELSALKKNAQGRLDSDEYEKENAQDFVLWKAWKPSDGNVYWDTELGRGRPGWHIECSAMSMKHLGETIDIHTGGVDLVFPHHTNEIAQAEAATGKQFVRYWLHNEHLLVEGQKMSKSLGNVFILRDLLARGLKPAAIRYTLLATNYTMPLNFTFEGVRASEGAIERLNNFIFELQHAPAGALNPKLRIAVEKASKGFEDALDDNLNVSKALAVLFEFIRQAYRLGFRQGDSELVLDFLKRADSVLGVMSFEQGSVAENIEQLIRQRDEARRRKDWKAADLIRQQLLEKGIELLDTPEGTRWKRVNK